MAPLQLLHPPDFHCRRSMWATPDAYLPCGRPEHLHALTSRLQLSHPTLAICNCSGSLPCDGHQQGCLHFQAASACFGWLSSHGAADMSPRGSLWPLRLHWRHPNLHVLSSLCRQHSLGSPIFCLMTAPAGLQVVLMDKGIVGCQPVNPARDALLAGPAAGCLCGGHGRDCLPDCC